MTDLSKSTLSLSPHAKLQPVNHASVRWNGGFWGERFQQCEEVILPSMFKALNTPENSAVFSNFYVAAGLQEGEHSGTFWSDGDCYKWMEAAAHVYGITQNAELNAQLDELIDVINQAQEDDGYICTQIQLTGKERWSHQRFHELYNMGQLFTAACVHQRATGKESFLNIAIKLAEYLYSVFQPRPERLAHFGFNPSNIMGLVDLYRATGEARYLELAQIFVDMRGSQPGGSDQNQARVPLRAETETVGHAVTATYLYCGAADVCAETGEAALMAALERIWEDMAHRKVYITGGVGPIHDGLSKRHDQVHEAFDFEYHLHNAKSYNETCANIGNAMWNWRMLQLTGNAKYADLMEVVLYNSGLSGMSIDGKRFTYTNPLRWHGKDQPLLRNDTGQRWFTHTCYCCPPQVARTIARLHERAYSLSDNGVWVHLYGSNHLQTELADGSSLVLTQETDYPWQGTVKLQIEEAPDGPVAIHLRIPGWAAGTQVAVNGEPVDNVRAGTYLTLKKPWWGGDVIEISLPLRVRAMKAHPWVEEVSNHVAIMRGPLVYCLESVDLPAGVSMSEIHLDTKPDLQPRVEPAKLGGLTVLEGLAQRLIEPSNENALYFEAGAEQVETIPIQMGPYYAWNNRGVSQMTVWLPRS